MRTPYQAAQAMLYRYKTCKKALDMVSFHIAEHKLDSKGRAYWEAVMQELRKLDTLHE